MCGLEREGQIGTCLRRGSAERGPKKDFPLLGPAACWHINLYLHVNQSPRAGGADGEETHRNRYVFLVI